jgi:hypothetical protein
MHTVKLVMDALVAIGTLAVAAVAVWGEKIRAWLAPPRLVLRPHTLRGAPALLKLTGVIMPSGGMRGTYYHLR